MGDALAPLAARVEGAVMGLFVLLLENDDALREAYRKLLNSAGHVVMGAASFDQAKEMVAHNRFDIALLDWKLDDHHRGTELVRELRRGTFVILISGFSTEDMRAGYLDPLADIPIIMGKPLDWKALQATLARVEASLENTPPRGTSKPGG